MRLCQATWISLFIIYLIISISVCTPGRTILVADADNLRMRHEKNEKSCSFSLFLNFLCFVCRTTTWLLPGVKLPHIICLFVFLLWLDNAQKYTLAILLFEVAY